MTVFHVATTGSDSADGSAEQPFRTINRGARRRPPGRHRAGARRGVPRVGRPACAAGSARTVASPTRPPPASTSWSRAPSAVTGWEQVGGPVWRVRVPERPLRRLQPLRRGDRRRLDRAPRARLAAPAPRRGLPRRARLYEVLTADEVGRPERRTEVTDHWTGIARAGRRPGPDAARLARRGRRRDHDDHGELRRRRPERAPRRDQRAPLGLLPAAAPPRLHHRARLRARPGGLPVDPADRRPARPHRAQLGAGLGHRGQRHPRRQVLGGLAGQGGLDRAQLRRPRGSTSRATSTSWSRSSPPSRSAGTPSTSARTWCVATTSTTAARTGSSATSGCVFSTIEDNHIHHIATAASSTATRSAASSCTPRSTSRSATTTSTTARSAPGWTGRRRARGSRATSSPTTAATSSSRSATARTSSTTTCSAPPSPSSRSARAARTSTTSCAARCGWRRSWTARRRTTARTARRSPATPSSTAPTTAGSATCSSAARARSRTGTGRSSARASATAPPSTTATRRPSRTTSG